MQGWRLYQFSLITHSGISWWVGVGVGVCGGGILVLNLCSNYIEQHQNEKKCDDS